MDFSRLLLLPFGILFTICVRTSSGFYVPGVAPHEFKKGDPIEIQAVKMTSVRTQIPYDYYSLPFCEPAKKHYVPENLGEILRGDRIVNTGYIAHMNVKATCEVLCGKKKFSKEEAVLMAKRINEDYSVHMIIDNLPGSTKFFLEDGTEQYEPGYKLGKLVNGKIYLNNHLRLVISYNHDEAKDIYRVVGFDVFAASIAAVSSADGNKCTFPAKDKIKPLLFNETNANEVLFTYDVEWTPSTIKWASRWDKYLKMSNVQVHWFAIMNSTVIVLFLTGILAMIIIRTLRRDIANYNKDDDIEEAIEETGWKLVHGDVFRPPVYALFLSGINLQCSHYTLIP